MKPQHAGEGGVEAGGAYQRMSFMLKCRLCDRQYTGVSRSVLLRSDVLTLSNSDLYDGMYMAVFSEGADLTQNYQKLELLFTGE